MKKEIVPVKNSPPMVVDFSERAISRSVRSLTLQRPATVYPVMLSIPATIAVVLLKLPFWAFGVAIAGVGFGLVHWVVDQFFRYDHFAALYTMELREEMERRKRQSIEDLKTTFETAGLEKGIRQIEDLEEKFSNLRGILEGKFNQGELTYLRYLGIAEQVYLAVLDNIHDIVPMLQSISTIDEDELKRRLASGRNKALEERLALRGKQLEEIDKILSDNEEALTELDRTAAAIADVRTIRGEASMDMEHAMLELQDLAGRSRNYAAQ